MTSAGPAPIEKALAAQRLASDPAVSAFVDANAGAGKTTVLTVRVARLLLAGAEPARILCITYTKAAAAEMADRLLKLLGEWALSGDAALGERLRTIEGADAGARSAHSLARARGLFARALETPGGLRIQTIHSFCENVLKRFPLETGAAPGFSVLDEKEAAGLAAASVDRAFVRAASHKSVGSALARLTAALQPDKVRELLIANLLSRQKLEEARRIAGGWQGLIDDCPRRFGLRSEATADAIRAGAIADAGEAEIRRLQASFGRGGKTCREIAEKEFVEILSTDDAETRFALLRRVFVTGRGTPNSKVPDKAALGADPWAGPYCDALKARLVAAAEDVASAENCADTAAFLVLMRAAGDDYRRAKDARAGLDYDDLVEKTQGLFRSGAADWVRYKLDQAIDHVLLDEAQDTSPAQWDVVEGPLAEFFAGAGARTSSRTFFAVGDKKQSIYSFQGADAALFEEKQQDLGKTIEAAQAFRNVALRLSFRSTAPVLRFVDALFADPAALEGVSAERPLSHQLKRIGEAGGVELWPLAPLADGAQARAWDAPLDLIAEDNPKRRLAKALAADIRRRLREDRSVAQDRPLRAKDFLILVQSRGPLFHEMIRALGRAGVPVAGADRIRLLEEPAVEDVLSFAKAVLLPTDDLSLAETLRSPFFHIDEASLYDLAHGRAESLWKTLRLRAPDRPEWAEAAAAIARARRIGTQEGAFAFISHLLDEGDPPGRKRLYRRLGQGAEEPLNELLRLALDYEMTRPRSLQGFLNWAERNAVEIKRDPEQGDDAARVMTVHGAKGLEAEIVILLDAHRGPNLSHLGPLFHEGPRGRSLPILSSDASAEGGRAAAARAEARRREDEEYRRLLYVAATRAKDRLIVCGVEQGNVKNPGARPVGEKTWHALASDAFDRLSPVSLRPAPLGGEIRLLECAQEVAAIAPAAAAPADNPAAPDWLRRPASPERRPLRLTPSLLAPGDAPAYSPLRPSASLMRGKALHRLIEILPQVAAARRSEVADRLLERHARATAPGERAQWREEALAVLADPVFAPVFADGSLAEVAIAGRIATPAGEQTVSGRIDRLAVSSARVLIVDYKTNRPPPQQIEDTPDAYAAQLAAYRGLLRDIYPGRRVEAALLWTYEARLTPLPDGLLDRAFARVFASA